VIWALTVLSFFGTVVAVLLLFFVFEEKAASIAPDGQPRKIMQHRLEPRTWASIALELSTLRVPVLREKVMTENISHHGVCARTRNPWAPNNVARVTFLHDQVSVRARVAYCNPSGDAFAVGLQFSTAIDVWIPATVWLGYRRP
jgi:hypothetical protein